MSTAPALRPGRMARRLAIGCVVALAAIVSGGSPASAHTDFLSSTPADGAVVDEPVRLVTIAFTSEATPVGEEFVALDGDGQLRTPSSVSTVDDKLFSLVFDPPLAGGTIGVRWSVQAPDVHPIEGAFSFVVNAPAPTTVPPSSVAPSTPVPAEDVPPQDVSAAAVDASAPDEAADPDPAAPDADAATTRTELDEFLDVHGSAPGTTTATIGRVIEFLGIAFAIGILAFAATTLRGSRGEIGMTLLVARILGGVIVIGALVEFVGINRMQGESLFDSWTTAPRPATMIRMAGGLAIAAGVVAVTSPVRRVVGAPLPLSAATIDAPLRTGASVVRWRADRTSWAAAVGVTLVTISFWFDGHTVSKGVRPLHAVVNSVHVLAGSVWAGGVVAMAGIVAVRHHAGRPMRAAELVIRFSRIASIALAAVLAAGAVMAVMVLDSFGDLTGTQWGKMLLLKTSAVGLALIGGAYNHFRLLPALEARPDDPALREQLRSTLTAEAIMLTFVVIVTAWLVSGAS